MYFASLLFPLLVAIGLLLGGAWSLLTPIAVFGVGPILELLWKRTHRPQHDLIPADGWAQVALVATAVAHSLTLPVFALRLGSGEARFLELLGWSLSVGIACGVVGINLGHELCHRSRRGARMLGLFLLSMTGYMHFEITHGRLHHRCVGTARDLGTARRGESIYGFLARAVPAGLRFAWRSERARLASRAGVGWPVNGVFVCLVAEILIALAFYVCGGWRGLVGLAIACSTGVLLLETVNYLGHYGLTRARLPDGSLEPVEARHAWSSECPIDRLMLFELTRHADHHVDPGRPYHRLRVRRESPELPTGYAGMILLAWIPPAWFRVMDPLLVEGRRHASHRGQERSTALVDRIVT